MKKSMIIIILLFAFHFSACDMFQSDDIGNQKYSEAETLDKMQGFWIMMGNDGDISEETKQKGVAFNVEGEKMEWYTDFAIKEEDIDVILSDGNVLEYYNDGENENIEILFENTDGYEMMILKDDTRIYHFEKSTIDLYYLYMDFSKNGEGTYDSSTDLNYELTDKELAWYISDTYWNEWYYLYADSSYEEMSPYKMVLYSEDMSGIMEYVDETLYVSWEVSDRKLYITYEDGDRYYFPIDYEYDNTTGYAYLYLYDIEEGYEDCAWVLWDYVEQ